MFDDGNELVISDFDKANSFVNEFKEAFIIDKSILPYITSLLTLHPLLVPPDISHRTIAIYLLKSNS